MKLSGIASRSIGAHALLVEHFTKGVLNKGDPTDKCGPFKISVEYLFGVFVRWLGNSRIVPSTLAVVSFHIDEIVNSSLMLFKR